LCPGGIGAMITAQLLPHRVHSSVEFNRFSVRKQAPYFISALIGVGAESIDVVTDLESPAYSVSSKNLYSNGMYSPFFLFIPGRRLLPAGDSLGFFSLLGTLFNFAQHILFL
jgi:hypothetical protein